MRISLCVAGVVVALACSQAGCGPSKQDPGAKSEMTPAPAASAGYYAEESHKGRLYVFGTEKAHNTFKASQNVPNIAKTFIAAGPEGQTLVFEADAKTNDLQDRLKAQYESRHSTKLP